MKQYLLLFLSALLPYFGQGQIKAEIDSIDFSSLSAMIYSMSGDYPFLMVAFLQIVVFVGTYLKMDEILSMVALDFASSTRPLS